MLRTFTFILTFCLLSASLMAQTYKLKGKVIDSRDRSPMAGAVVVASPVTDTLNRKGVVVDTAGVFSLDLPAAGDYLVKVHLLGYSDYRVKMSITQPVTFLGVVKLQQEGVAMKEVEIKGVEGRAVQKGDTTQYNAKAFKTNPDADAGDLVTKMPGIQVDKDAGTVKAHGEDVKQVLVDGKQYFGDDAMTALKNLPAESVDKVEVFDKRTDQAQFTGFDDGQSFKAINIVTKKDHRDGQFGRFVAGYGTDGRYQASASVNFFHGNRRISVVGQSNNINQQNFSSQDLLGITGGGANSSPYMPGSRGNNFLVSPQGGINKTNALGLNYSDSIGKHMYLTGSYFFNNSDNTSQSTLTRNYFAQKAGNSVYNETHNNTSQNFNHRINLRLEYQIDSLNSLILTPRLNTQLNDQHNTVTGQQELLPATALNQTQTNYKSHLSGISFSNDLLLRHRFSKPGRTLSWNIGTDVNTKRGSDTLHSTNNYYDTKDSASRLDQYSTYPTSGYTLSTTLNYTEPLGKNNKSQLMLNYSPSYTYSKANKQTFATDGNGMTYNTLDSALSNIYNTNTFTNRGGASLRHNGTKYSLMLGINYQYSVLRGQQDVPTSFTISRPFSNVLPTAMLNYRFNPKSNLRIMYQTNTGLPSITQLQSVINNNNPLLLTTGNPDLIQQFNHSLNVRYSLTNFGKSNNFFAFASASTTKNYIANATNIALRDSVLPGGLILPRGAQISHPVNLDGYYSLRSYLSYGLPVSKIKSNLNFNAGVSFTAQPALVNDVPSSSNTTNFNQGFVLSSNISPQVDYTLNYNNSYSIVRNTVNRQLNENYFTQSIGFRFNWITWKGITLSPELNEKMYSGLGAAYDQNITLLNASLGKKLFKNQAGEIKLYVYDLLNQNKSISRNITESYVEDVRTNVLTRYVMVMFTYNLRNFKGAAPAELDNKNNNNGDSGPHMHRWHQPGE